jgi:predicted polyphosphate/ATP-dependent NAD kinase
MVNSLIETQITDLVENVHILKLIEGKFTPEDAGKILNELIMSKINYHNREILSIKEKYNGDVSHSEKRIAELNQVRLSLKELLDSAREQGKELKISSTIEIVLK